MLDNFLESAHDISVVLLPILGVIVLISLIILLVKIIKVVNDIPKVVLEVNNKVDTTLNKVNDTIDTTNESIKKLETPLDTIIGVSETVDIVNKSATGIVSSVAGYAIKNSDSLVNWSKDLFKKDHKEEDSETSNEEDFGVYE